MTKTVEKPLYYLDMPKFGFKMRVWKVLKPSRKSGAVSRRYCSSSSATAPPWCAFTVWFAVTGKGSISSKEK